MFVDDSRDLSAIAFAHCTAASFLVRSGRQTRADRGRRERERHVAAAAAAGKAAEQSCKPMRNSK